MNTPDLKPNDKNKAQGIMVFFGGVVLLLYAFGLLQQGLNILVIGLAIVMIVYGSINSGISTIAEDLIHKIKHFLNKK